jgi:hypothetical protein
MIGGAALLGLEITINRPRYVEVNSANHRLLGLSFFIELRNRTRDMKSVFRNYSDYGIDYFLATTSISFGNRLAF